MIQIDSSSFGGRLETARRLRNIPQTKMAEIAGVSRTTYRKVEDNEASLSIEGVLNIAKEFNISLEYLLTGVDLLEKKNDKLSNIKDHTQIDSKIDEGCLITTIKVPLFDYLS